MRVGSPLRITFTHVAGHLCERLCQGLREVAICRDLSGSVHINGCNFGSESCGRCLEIMRSIGGPHIWIFILARQEFSTIRLLNDNYMNDYIMIVTGLFQDILHLPTCSLCPCQKFLHKELWEDCDLESLRQKPHKEVPNLHCHGDHGHVVRCRRTHGSHCPRSFCSHFLSSFIKCPSFSWQEQKPQGTLSFFCGKTHLNPCH